MHAGAVQEPAAARSAEQRERRIIVGARHEPLPGSAVPVATAFCGECVLPMAGASFSISRTSPDEVCTRLVAGVPRVVGETVGYGKNSQFGSARCRPASPRRRNRRSPVSIDCVGRRSRGPRPLGTHVLATHARDLSATASRERRRLALVLRWRAPFFPTRAAERDGMRVCQGQHEACAPSRQALSSAIETSCRHAGDANRYQSRQTGPHRRGRVRRLEGSRGARVPRHAESALVGHFRHLRQRFGRRLKARRSAHYVACKVRHPRSPRAEPIRETHHDILLL
jgi:hypothetical protein